MPPQDRPSHNEHGATWGPGRRPNQPRGAGGEGGEPVATRQPGQSNADNTTTKLEIDIPTTKVINTQLCQTRTMFDLKKRKKLMVSKPSQLSPD